MRLEGGWPAMGLHAVFAAVLLLLGGCADLGYYLQSVQGQMQVNAARRPLEATLADDTTAPALKRRLQRAAAIRAFAIDTLKLPDNASYRSYADLQRSYVVWNVFAAGALTLEPQRWCFPFAGCVGYRGYFSREAADGFAHGLRESGLDVHVAGVPAYSTLGWFDDPLLNTFIHYPDYELARLIFHELAHQVVYVPGDSEFNESFAMAVESAGLERWLTREGDMAMREAAAQAASRRAAVFTLMQSVRSELASLYRLRIAPDFMRERKAEILADAQQRYLALKTGWNGYAGYDALFAGLNNAQLAAFTLYHAWLPALQRVFARGNGDFTAFYAEARRLAALPKEAREAQLAAP